MQKKVHVCSQEKEIGEMQNELHRISHDVFGNGQEGLTKIIPRLETKMQTVMDTMLTHTNILQDLTKQMVAHIAVSESDNKTKEMSWTKAGIIISSIVGLASVITAIIIKQ